MNSAGPGNIPGVPRLPGQGHPASAQPPPNAQIVKLPDDLKDVREVLLVRGTVSESKPDGTVKIETPQGTVEVKISPPAQRPAEGQTVDIELQPGRPPQTARVTPEETASKPPPQPPPRTAETPVDIELQRPDRVAEPPPRYSPEQVQEKQAVVAQALPPGQVVRLEPIPAAQALETVPDPLETIPAVVTEAVTVKALPQAIVQKYFPDTAITENLPEHVVLPAQAGIQSFTATDNLFFAQTEDGNGGKEHFLQTGFLLKPDKTTGIAENVLLNFFKTPDILPGLHIPDHLPDTDIFYPADLRLLTVSEITLPLAHNAASIKPEIFTARVIASQPLSVRLVPADGRSPQGMKNIAAPPTPPILANQTPGVITATVIGQTVHHLPIVHFFAQEKMTQTSGELFFVVHTPADLAPGAQITLMPQGAAPVITAATPVMPAPLSFTSPQPWPLLDEIAQALMQVSPQAAQAFTNVMPSPTNPAQIGPAALFFIAAANGGDLTQWLGERVTDILRRDGRSGLLSRLSGETSTSGRPSSEISPQDWRGVSIPLYWDETIHKLSLHYKHDYPDEKDQKTGGRQARFIFDLNLDHMGKVQLDGLFRDKKLDLIVRTQQAMSQAMQMQMRRAYINALEPTEIRGELSFQNKPEQWVTIKAESKQKFGTSA